MSFRKVDPKQSLPKMEEEVLKFWEEQKIFEKSVDRPSPKGDYVFYDGPPFATGTPHYGHIVGSVMKDVVPRYWTMRGYRVERKWGWDCHGLPIENIAEKELGIKRKTEIEEMGVEKFNEFCRSKVLDYVTEWKKVITRLGRWADMENAYKTMDLPFMESVWWVFKQLWDKGLIYEGYRSMHICTRCETTLSQQEVSEGYKDIKDLSATVKFELEDEPGTFVLAWTTTPWTLIGNVALAVGKDIDYVKVKLSSHSERSEESRTNKSQNVTKSTVSLNSGSFADAQDDNCYILAKDRADGVLKDKEYEIISEFKGRDLIGKKYKPLFDYYVNKGLQNEENGWQIYAGDFVTTVEGTGVVHIAPAFGEDDLNLSYQYKLPFVQHVGMDGLIKKEAVDFAGMSVKPQEDPSTGSGQAHQKTDVEIIKYLAKNNLLFAKEKYEHSYPHCWRCDTPLINYATSSWFVNVTKVKEKALKLAKNINWSPAHIKEGRFGNWLAGARDWSISRQRYWASVMPIWKCDKCEEVKVVGSIDEIRDKFGNPNKLFLVRHGEAEHNVKNILHSDLNKDHYSLTEKGIKQVGEVSERLKLEKIKVIFTSPFLRTKETAKIISKVTGAKIIIDERLRESGMGKFDGSLTDNWSAIEKILQGRLNEKNNEGVESFNAIKERLKSFVNDLNQNNKNENIIIVSHGDPLATLRVICESSSNKKIEKRNFPDTGGFYQVYSKYIDLHKHVIDKITFKCGKCSSTMKRIPDVLDTWFDSGSMPYAQMHYPFENKEKFEQNFPAEFIAEGVDQTRAWFYYLHIIGTAIKNSRAYNNVIVNGIVLAEDGKKMAKRLKNYPDPTFVMEKYGADALRFYLMSSPVVAAENLELKESDVADLVRGMFRMLWNSYSFFVLYANIDGFKPGRLVETRHASSLPDRRIISELNLLIKEVNSAMENYELNRACRLFPKFIGNLSNWYIRRSRKRFWKSENDKDKNEAYQTLYAVLVELSKLMAPFTPFVAEEIYRNLTCCHSERSEESRDNNSQDKILGEVSLNSGSFANAQDDNIHSVHLVNFPAADEKLIDEKLNQEMEKTREIITEALQLRARAGIKVRQPLVDLRFKIYDLRKEFLEIIKEEVNVKEVIFDKNISENIVLDTEITEDLKLEGQAREIIRFIQEMRKEAGYEVDNRIKVAYFGGEAVFIKFGDLIQKEVLAKELKMGEMVDSDLSKEFDIEKNRVKIQIRRQ